MLYRFGDFELDTDLVELTRAGELQQMEPKVFSLLVCLIANRDRVVGKDELISMVWDGRVVSDAALNTGVNALRRALGDSGSEQAIIRTVPRKGFRFVLDVMEGKPAVAESLPSSKPGGSQFGRPSIAVLPFKMITAEADQDYIADGMVEDITTLLATVPEIFVIARNSTSIYREQSFDIRKIAEELDVRYVLNGSVQKAGTRLRVTAQFVDALTGSQIWAGRFDNELEDIFKVQDEVSQGIVGALQSRLLVAESVYVGRQPPEKLDAWGNVVKARTRMFAYRPEDIDQAEPFARRALEIQPDYAQGHAILGQILAWRSYNGWTDDWLATGREAHKCARRALELGADNPTVLTDAAFAYIWLGLFLKAEPIAERAVELNPNSAFNCSVCGHVLAIVGRQDEGIELTRKAFLLSPRDPVEYMFHLYEGSALFFADDQRAAQRALEHSLRLKPDLMFPRMFLAAIFEKEGRTEDAQLQLKRIIDFGSGDAIKNIFRPRPEGTLWPSLTEPIRRVYDGDIPSPVSV